MAGPVALGTEELTTMPYYCKHCITGIGKTRELHQYREYENGEWATYFHCTYCDAPDTKDPNDVNWVQPTAQEKEKGQEGTGPTTHLSATLTRRCAPPV
jgi:hypothetical protein